MFHVVEFADFLDSPLEIVEFLIPITIIFYVLRYIDYYLDTPKYQDFSNLQKVWLFLHSLRVDFTAKVEAALGEDFMASCLAEAANLPDNSGRWTIKIRQEFAKKASNLSDHESFNFTDIKLLNTENETIWLNYKDDINKLVDDISQIWPCQPKVEEVFEQ
ncbi:hypothetical protein IJT10_00215 [bacterium]|nr:hypothetical protein [bacterium]